MRGKPIVLSSKEMKLFACLRNKMADIRKSPKGEPHRCFAYESTGHLVVVDVGPRNGVNIRYATKAEYDEQIKIRTEIEMDLESPGGY